MKKYNKFLAGVMAVCLMGSISVIPESISPAVSLTASAEEVYTYENLTYDFLEDGTIEITGCDKSATEVVIPAEIDGVPVTSIGKNAFYECSSLTSIEIPESITNIRNNAFYKCSNLTSVKIPDSLTSIEVGVFANCSSLTSIEIPDSVTSIKGGAFCHCNNLESITIPDNVTIIGGLAFYDTPWINERKTENSIITINNILIDGMSCKGSVVIPDNVTSIADEAFLYCESLTSIEIPDNVTSIGYYTFSECKNLNEVTILNPDCEIYDNSETFTNGWDSTKLTISFNGTIYGYENSTAQEYAEKYKRKFVSLGEAPKQNTATGDFNGDGDFNISDVVIFQKYILGSSDTEISDWKQADLYPDGVLDVFDLCLMKKKLIEK
ncbi:MAG: leucine-rich repeat protein [Ruminococcus sp.]|nr:leucine-rich repeat protein [Ruminococcus sp.]